MSLRGHCFDSADIHITSVNVNVISWRFNAEIAIFLNPKAQDLLDLRQVTFIGHGVTP